MEIKVINKDEFESVLTSLNAPSIIDKDYLYELYEEVINGVKDVLNISQLSKITPVNHVVVILYIINEYMYAISSLKTKDDIVAFNDNEENFTFIASLCCDKYLTNEQLHYESKSFLNKFNPPIATFELYLNFTLKSFEKDAFYPKTNKEKIIYDMLTKAFKLSKAVIALLLDGFETEAFSTWRTLHENECILICLLKYGDPIINEYLKHITYALAYRKGIASKDETDKIFENIKSEMKNYDLKSKDMKKFIEYGYLFKVPNVVLNQDFKLNFRDGVEKLAGLENYSKLYEMASEIAHSSPLLLYSRRDYFFNLTLINLYETFYRLEEIFKNYYRAKVNDNAFKQYEQIRKVYLGQLYQIHKNIRLNFIKRFPKKDNE